MKYLYAPLIALAISAFADSSASTRPLHPMQGVQQDTRTDADGKTDTRAKASGKSSKTDSEDANATGGEAIVFPKALKVGSGPDEWEAAAPEHSGRTNSGNRRAIR